MIKNKKKKERKNILNIFIEMWSFKPGDLSSACHHVLIASTRPYSLLPDFQQMFLD